MKQFEEIKPVLEAFCENIFHVGGPGAGHKVKLINNFLAMSQAAMTAEAFCACAATGVDPRKFYEVLSAGGVNSPVFQMIASKALEAVKTGSDLEAAAIYVCPVCGNTVEGAAPDKCQVCGMPGEKFIEIQ